MSGNYVWILAILASVLFGFLLAWAGSDGSMQIYGLPLFSISVVFAFLIQWICLFLLFFFKQRNILILRKFNLRLHINFCFDNVERLGFARTYDWVFCFTVGISIGYVSIF